MAPFVIATSPEYWDRGPGAAVAKLGQRVTEISTHFHGEAERVRREREDRRLKEEHLELERQKAEAMLQRSQAKQAGEAQALAADQASVQGTTESLQAEGDRATQLAGEQGFGSTLSSESIKGRFGPFGLITAGTRGAIDNQRMRDKVAHDVQLASQMKPADARAHLAQKKAEYAKEALATGYQQANALLQRSQDEDASEQITPEDAVGLNELLQTAMAEGKSADGVIGLIAKHYKANADLKGRDRRWKDADKKADEYLAALNGMADAAPTDVDPVTLKPKNQEFLTRLQEAQDAWEATNLPSHRARNEPNKELAALQAFVSQGQAQADPEGFIKQSRQKILQGRRDRGEAPFRPLDQRGILGGEGRTPPATRASAAGHTGKGSGAEKQGRAEPARGQAPPAAARQMSAMVQQAANKTLRAGTTEERAKRIGELRKQIANDLGLDPNAEDVDQAIRQVLSSLYGPAAPQ